MAAGNALEAEWGEPWKNEETLRRLYWGDELSLHQIGQRLGCKGGTVKYWMEKYGIPRREHGEATRKGLGAPDELWDGETVQQLYEGGLSTREIGEELGCHGATVQYVLEQEGIERRSLADALRVERASHHITSDGYERWRSQYRGERDVVAVHQLLACLDHDPHEVFAHDTEVHHASGHGLDNRPENVELLTRSEHRKHHTQTEVPECKHQVVQTATIMEEERA